MSAAIAPLLLSSLFAQCAPDVAPETLMAVTGVESAARPYVVANVTDNTSHAFDDKGRAVAFLNTLAATGKDYSAGLMQINARNFRRLGLTNETVFDHCANIRAGGKVLHECYVRALNETSDKQQALRHALSCYYSGNFVRGYRKEAADGKSYIERIEDKASVNTRVVVPALQTEKSEEKGETENKTYFLMNGDDNTAWDVFGDYAESSHETADSDSEKQHAQ